MNYFFNVFMALVFIYSCILQASTLEVFNNTAYMLSLKIDREHYSSRFEKLNAYERKKIDLEDVFVQAGKSMPSCATRLQLIDTKSNKSVYDKPFQGGCKNKSITIVRTPANIFDVITK